MGLCLHWMLSESKDNSVVGFIFLIKAAVIGKETVPDNSQDGGDMAILYVFVLSVLRCLYRLALFCLECKASYQGLLSLSHM